MVGFLRSRTGTTRSLDLRRGKEHLVVDGRHDVAIDDGDAYLAAGLAGLGVVALPDYMTAAHTKRGELVRLFEEWRVAPMPLVVLSPPNRHPSERLRVFVEWLASLMKDLTPKVKPRRAGS